MTHMDSLSLRFGRIIRELRLRKGVSQERLAEQASLDRTFVSMIERGRRRPTLDTAKRLADALGSPLSKIIAFAEKKKG